MTGICPLFSGSKANSTVITDNKSSIIVDIGASFKSFLLALENIGENIENIKAIAITHEHSDHIAGLKTFLKNINVPVIASKQTADFLTDNRIITPKNDVILADSSEIVIGDILINRFPTSHDCIGSSGYTVSFDGSNFAGICTDTGFLTKEAKGCLKGCKTVIIESNHDITMLKNGPYPPQLKMRILSDLGHLSNTACAEFLPTLLESGTTRFILGHLSQNNNTPMLAEKASNSALSAAGAKENSDYILYAAKPNGNEVMPF